MKNTELNPQTKKKALKVLKKTGGSLCPRCLGRIFSQEVEGEDNQERGIYLKKEIIIPETYKNSRETDKSLSTKINDPPSCEISDASSTATVNSASNSSCFICNNIFNNIEEKLIERIANDIKNSNIEFETFLVGSRVDKHIIEREKDVQDSVEADVENIKKEINREIGKALSVHMVKEVEFDNPQLVVLIDFTKDIVAPSIEYQINPLFIEGRYKKLIRGIPQTKWPCRKCKGAGCENCDDTGKMYQESVEELISPEILEEARGSQSKFHGAGREDIDVRMLGNGRPFVLEIKEPHKRVLNLDDLERKINLSAVGKVEVSTLKFVDKSRRAQIKTSSTDTYKVYKAIVALKRDITARDITKIESMHKIEQRTPQRVAHRRADLVRHREIRNIDAEVINERLVNLIIKCQGGLYIKELISGDNNRTQPSVSSIMESEALCVELDVLEVNIAE